MSQVDKQDLYVAMKGRIHADQKQGNAMQGAVSGGKTQDAID